MLDLAVLGMLHDGPLHGYQVRRRLHELGFRRVSFGSLYPAIRRLEGRGWIAARRGTGRRKEYGLTDEGRHAFDELLDGRGDDDERRFRIRLAFFSHLDPDRRVAVLEERRAMLTDRLAEVRRTRRRGTPADRYTAALMERSVATTESEIAWLDGLIAAERAGRR